MLVAVVLPTYNEGANVEKLLRQLRIILPDAFLLVVDDNSPDGTGEIAESCGRELGNVEVLHRTIKQGLGSAYRHGFSVALERKPDVIMSMDADFSHDPLILPEMLLAIAAGADVVIGSRYITGGATRDWPLHRRLLSRWGNLYTASILGMKVRDCTSGFRAYRTSALSDIAPQTTRAEGYAFLTELLLRSSRQGFNLVEVPITFIDRQYGTSKMSSRIVIESMALVTLWGVRHRWMQLKNLVIGQRKK